MTGTCPGEWLLLLLFSIGNESEYINRASRQAQQNIHDVYNIGQKAKQEQRKQKTSSFSLFQPLPIYKAYHEYWLMVCV